MTILAPQRLGCHLSEFRQQLDALVAEASKDGGLQALGRHTHALIALDRFGRDSAACAGVSAHGVPLPAPRLNPLQNLRAWQGLLPQVESELRKAAQ